MIQDPNQHVQLVQKLRISTSLIKTSLSVSVDSALTEAVSVSFLIV